MKKCINCNENINDNALFCEHCGALQKEETKNAPSIDSSKLYEQKDILGSLHDEINELLKGFETKVENTDVLEKEKVTSEKEIAYKPKSPSGESDNNHKEYSEDHDATDASFQIKSKTVEPQNEINSLSKKINTSDKNTKKKKATDLSGLAIAVATLVFVLSCAMVISPKTFGFDNLDGVAEKWNINGMVDSVDTFFSEIFSDADFEIPGLVDEESKADTEDENAKDYIFDSKNSDYKTIEYSGTVVKKIMIPGKVYEVDLNCDGEIETIQYKVYDFDGYDVTNDINWFMSQVDMNELYTDIYFQEKTRDMPAYIGSGKIIINGNDILNIEGVYYEPYILLSDIDFNDQYTEILFEGFPCENEISTIVVRYSKDGLVKVGEIPGSPEYGATIDGSGMVKAKTEGWGVCCWLYDGEYILEDGMLREVDKEKYYMDVETTTLQGLDLYKSPNDHTVVESLKSGENVTLVYSDKKRWCYVQPENGTGGFVEITGEFGYKVNGVSSFDIFSDLPMWG